MPLPISSKLDDRASDQITLNEVERIAISVYSNHSPSQPVVLFF
jgi:hypothetical protein